MRRIMPRTGHKVVQLAVNAAPPERFCDEAGIRSAGLRPGSVVMRPAEKERPAGATPGIKKNDFRNKLS